MGRGLWSLDGRGHECRRARSLTVEADAGVKLDWVVWVGLGLFVVGLVMTIGGVVVILLIGRRASRDSTTAD